MASIKSGRIGRKGILFLLTMSLGYAVYAADRTVLQSVITAVKPDLGLTDVQRGLLLSAQYIGVLAVVLGAGHLSDRYGKWEMILIGVVTFSAFTWLIAFATDFYQAFTFRLLSGIGEGIFWPVAMSAVANYFREDRGLALGAFYVGFDAGGAGGSAIGGLSLSLTSGWRSAFLVAPLLGIAVVAGLFVARSSFAETDAEKGAVSLGRDAVRLLENKRILVIMLFAFLATYSVAVWQNYLTTYWNSVRGVDKAVAAYGYAAVLVSGGFGKLILGRLSDRRPRSKVILVIVSASLALFALFFLSGNVYSGFILALGAGFASSAMFPVMQALASDSSNGKTGTALGLTTTFQSVATVLSPTLTSYFMPQGVGMAIALNVTIPMLAVVLVAIFLSDPRT